ncbi:MAG: hypothetical protein LAO79_10010 [Acidobacteriia bacterium]|nr:hypothetical protein [Terriglobia bacterium]
MRYRIHSSTIALTVSGNHQAACSVHKGDVVEVVGPSADERFVLVRLNGEELYMFQADLTQRGTAEEIALA